MLKTITISIFATALLTLSLQAEETPHIFESEKGLISYKISGGGIITDETNLTISGDAKLYFSSWGSERIEKEDGVILTTGAIRHKQKIKMFQKKTQENITTVDFQNNQLLQRNISNKESKIDIDSCLVKIGKETIAGVECDLWEGVGVKKCIYKNILLKLEFNIFDISYQKIATNIEFDTNITEEMEIPNYTIHKFSLFQDPITKNETKAENTCFILKNLTDDVVKREEIEKIKREKFIQYITKDIYKKQKVLLPKLLTTIKETRECLQAGENPFSANKCIEKFSNLKAQLGTKQDDYIILWDEKRKAKLLNKIEDEILYLESRIACVKRAQNIVDLSKCMK
ncbi:MAG: hypothetical protein QM493_03370 [Sulfurovum sp.]